MRTIKGENIVSPNNELWKSVLSVNLSVTKIFKQAKFDLRNHSQCKYYPS